MNSALESGCKVRSGCEDAAMLDAHLRGRVTLAPAKAGARLKLRSLQQSPFAWNLFQGVQCHS